MNPGRNSYLAAISRRKWLLLQAVITGVAVSMAAFSLADKTYKVQTAISVRNEYFQVPLVQDFMPVTYNPAELKSQREALIRKSLNYDFLREVGGKFGLFGKSRSEDVSTYELESLNQHFEIVNVNATTYTVSYLSHNAEKGFNVMQEFVVHLRKSLATERRMTLLKLHDAIQDQLEVLSFGKPNSSVDLMSARPDLVKEQMTRIKEEIRSLEANYSSMHPRISELNHKLADLSRFIKPNYEEAPRAVRSEVFSGAKVDPASRELFLDLLKKYHYLEVVMYMDQQNSEAYLTQLQEPYVPTAPMWPKRPIYLGWGIAIGILMGAILVMARESGLRIPSLADAPTGFAPLGEMNLE